MSGLLEVSGVSVTFDGYRAINNLSFAIGEPEMRAIIGPNGAGKTTFMDIVTGKTRPDEGQVIWADQYLIFLSEEVLETLPGATIIADVKASQTLFDRVTAAGGEALMWRTGHSLIKAKMAEFEGK